MNRLPKRKSIRLQKYDYGMPGAYFITICTNGRKHMFGDVGADVVQAFKRYTTVEYSKMVHQGLLPPYDKTVWQRSFHDHVIRNQRDYDDIDRYIENNPLQWEQDELYAD